MSSDSDSDNERHNASSPKNADYDSESQTSKQANDTASKGPQTPVSPSRIKSPSPYRSPRSESPDPATQSPRSSSRSRSRSVSKSRSPSPGDARESSQAGPRSPPDNPEDDGRSNISSGSSIPSDRSQPRGDPKQESPEKPKSHFAVPNAEDLSDVSDIEDGDVLLEDDKADEEKREQEEKERRERAAKEKREVNAKQHRGSIHMDDGEQLDFEADEVEKEDGEVDVAPVVSEKKPIENSTAIEKEKSKKDVKEDGEEGEADDGEVKEDGEGDGAESLEEGEVSDEGDPKPEKPPICRFYSRGACTWGSSCRFLHPGVTDKGNYSMFDVSRPLVAPSNGIPAYLPEPRPYHPLVPPVRVLPSPYAPPPLRREDPAAVESAWERGLRQAKELMRKSTKRKETDLDFEEKKMNLTIGQEEMDKENDYYTRVASPADDVEAWPKRASPNGETRRPAVRVVERYEDIIAGEPPSTYDRYEYRRGYDKAEYAGRREKKYYTEEELLARSKSGKKRDREVIVHRHERTKRAPSESGKRPDEWLDPWMRSKSPGKKGSQRSRKVSYSSGSSSYSGSSSRSSSNSSYSSYSRSRSRSRSRSGSGSRSPRVPRRRPSPPPGLISRSKAPEIHSKFKPMKIGSVGEKTATMLMNPPAPSPRRGIKEKALSPSTAIRKVGLNPPAPTRPLTKTSSKSRGRKSRSSSTGSSGSSSGSSHSSYSSSSGSSGSASPPARKKGELGKVKPTVDSSKLGALKTAKLATKTLDSKRDKAAPVPPIAGKKRPANEPPAADAPDPAKASGSKKTSRREELLKQLKAVEDAIAKKRNKV